jgi:hypothetical protein
VFGGTSGARTFFNDVWEFNTTVNSWRQLLARAPQGFPLGRVAAAGTLLSSAVLSSINAGVSVLDSASVSNSASGPWLVVFGGKADGAGTADGFNVLSDLWVLTFDEAELSAPLKRNATWYPITFNGYVRAVRKLSIPWFVSAQCHKAMLLLSRIRSSNGPCDTNILRIVNNLLQV